MASAGSFKVPHGPDGTVWIGMMDKTYQGAVDNAICSKPTQGEGVLSTLRDSIPFPVIGDGNKAATPATAAPKSNGTDAPNTPATGSSPSS
jgi:hypothetical protein